MLPCICSNKDHHLLWSDPRPLCKVRYYDFRFLVPPGIDFIVALSGWQEFMYSCLSTTNLHSQDCIRTAGYAIHPMKWYNYMSAITVVGDSQVIMAPSADLYNSATFSMSHLTSCITQLYDCHAPFSLLYSVSWQQHSLSLPRFYSWITVWLPFIMVQFQARLQPLQTRPPILLLLLSALATRWCRQCSHS